MGGGVDSRGSRLRCCLLFIIIYYKQRFVINPAAGSGKPLPSRLSMLACNTEKGKTSVNDALIYPVKLINA